MLQDDRIKAERGKGPEKGGPTRRASPLRPFFLPHPETFCHPVKKALTPFLPDSVPPRTTSPVDPDPDLPHRRRPRYRGKNPRAFHEKYKELAPDQHPETVAKVLAAGKTPAGSHRPILLPELLAVLDPRPGDLAVDCTLGYGGHAAALLERIIPEGHLLGLDVDVVEQARATERLRARGFGADVFTPHRGNFAGLPAALAQHGRPEGADLILADLGVSSMQIDDPARGFSVKHAGPLDMRLNPARGLSARDWLRRVTPAVLARALAENSDEPRADALAMALAGRDLPTTRALAEATATCVPHESDREDTVRRVFQAIRIAVNDEFSALDSLLRALPGCLKPGGRVAILSFHSGEDRRVKAHFRDGHRTGLYAAISDELLRAGPEERRDNRRGTRFCLTRHAFRPGGLRDPSTWQTPASPRSTGPCASGADRGERPGKP